MKKLTLEYVKNYIESFGYKLLSKKYINAHKKLKIKCNEGHIIKMEWASIQQGCRCSNCWAKSRKGKNNPSWKGGVTKKNISLYNTYSYQISWCEKTRRDPKNKDYLQVKCTNSECRKWFIPTRDSITKRIKAINGKSTGEHRFYCSDKCKQSCNLYWQQKYPKGQKPYFEKRPNQKEWADMVKERDNNICQRCGKEGKIAHHLEGLNVNPIMSADIDIGITLCKKCDKLAHSDIGCRPIDLTNINLCGGSI